MANPYDTPAVASANPYDTQKPAPVSQPQPQGQFLGGVPQDILSGIGSVFKDFVGGAVQGAKSAAASAPPVESIGQYFSGGANILRPGAEVLGQTLSDAVSKAKDAYTAWTTPGSTVAQKAAATGEAGFGALNVAFSPITSVLATLSAVPGVGYAAHAINGIFGALAGSGAEVAGHAVDNAQNIGAISSETAKTIKPVVQDTAALIAQLAAGIAGGGGVEDVASSELAHRAISQAHDVASMIASDLSNPNKSLPGFIRLNPFGETPEQGKADAEKIAAEKDPEKIAQTLRDMGVQSNIADAYAPKLAAADTPAQVTDYLQMIKGTGDILDHEAAQGAPAETPVSENIIPDSNLRTFDFSEMEGKPQTAEENAKIHDNIVNNPDMPMTQGGETFTNAADRGISTVKDIMEKPGNQVITTHNSMYGLLKLWNEKGRPDILDKAFREEYTSQDTPGRNQKSTGEHFVIKGPNGDIYVVRHGETVDNAKGVFRRAEAELTDKGRAEATKLGDVLKNKDISQIHTSDLPRAVETSKIIQKEISPEIKDQGKTEELKKVGPDEVPPKPAPGDTAYTGSDFVKQLPDVEQKSLAAEIRHVANSHYRATIVDYFETPEYVLGKLGLRREMDGIRDAYEKYLDNRKAELKKISDWRDKVKDIPDSSRAIFRFLDGHGERKPISDIFRELEDSGVKIPPEYESLVETAKKYPTFDKFYNKLTSQESDLLLQMNQFLWRHGVRDFGNWDLAEMSRKGPEFDRALHQAFYDLAKEKSTVTELSPSELEVARELKGYLQEWADRLKLPEDNQISHYITHIFENTMEAPTKDGELSFDDPELVALMRDQPAASVYDPFLQQRLGKRGYKEDVWAALDAYVKRATRKEAMDPALEDLKKASARLNIASYDYVTKFSHRINMRPTALESLVDNLITQSKVGYRFGTRPTAFISRKIRTLFYRGTLGLNVGSALRNLTQGVNTYAELGEKYTAIGYTKLVYRLMSHDLTELYDNHVLDEEFIQDKRVGVYKSFLQKIEPALFGLFEQAEKINRGAAYFGAKARALDNGETEEQAIRAGKEIVRRTQFVFGSIDTPVALNDDAVKTFTQLQTYSIKQIEFLGKKVAAKDFAGLIRYTIGSFVVLNTIGKLFGMTLNQIMPTVGIGGAPMTSLALNIVALFMGNTQQKASASTALKNQLWTFLPAGAQIRKTVQGLEAYYAGKDVTATGKTRFTIPQDAPHLLQAAIFGKSALPEAQSYYSNIGKKKTTSGGNPYN